MSVISLPAQRASQTPAFEKNVRHADIDSLRGFAMLAVVVSTAYQYCLNARGQLYNGTWLGRVLLSLDGVIGWFFVVSAFLLYALIVRQGLTGRGAMTPRGFLIRRLLRAVPLYWIAIIVVWAYRTSNLPGDWRDLAEHLTFTEVFDSKRIFYTIGPAWFIADEVMFYLFIAAIMTATIRHCHRAKTRESRLLAVSAPALLLILVSWGFKAWELFVSHVPANHWSTWYGPLAWADNLGFGMLLAVVWVAADGRLLSPRVLIGTRVGAGILFAAAVALRGQSAASVAMFHELCMISFVALLASSVFAAPDALWRRALARPFLAGIGTISFSLYIWHEPILLFLSDHTAIGSPQTSFWLIAVLLLVLSVPIAFVSYWVIEYPVGHLRSLFAPGGGLRDYYADDRVHLAMVEDRDEDQPPRRSLARQGAGRDHHRGAGADVDGRPHRSGEGGPADPGRRDGPAGHGSDVRRAHHAAVRPEGQAEPDGDRLPWWVERRRPRETSGLGLRPPRT